MVKGAHGSSKSLKLRSQMSANVSPRGMCRCVVIVLMAFGNRLAVLFSQLLIQGLPMTLT